MSEATPTPPELARYIAGVYAQEDDLLRELRAEIARRGMPQIHISAVEGKMLQTLLAAVGARRVVEIGTLGGYSALWMARALGPGGRLVTIELEPERAELARDFARRAGLEGVVEVRVGRAADVLREMDGEFDACFIDADKAGYPAYLAWARAHVRPGGLILGDNALLGGRVVEAGADDAEAEAMRDFNRSLAEDQGLVSALLPVRDGLAVAVVRAPAR